MARYRSIHSDISVDGAVSSLFEHGPWAVLLYTWAIPQADDFGRLTGDARQFKLSVCPGADITTADVEAALQQITDAGLWERYEVAGKKYIAFPFQTWVKHQSYIPRRKFTADTSKIPAPEGWKPLENANVQPQAPVDTPGESLPGQDNATKRHSTPLKVPSPSPSPSPSPTPSGDGETRDNPEPPAGGDSPDAAGAALPSIETAPGGIGNSEIQTDPKPPRKNATRILPEWEPSEKTLDAIAAECPTLNTETATRDFIDYWLGVSGKDGTKLDWDATWRLDMRRKNEMGKNQKPAYVAAAAITPYGSPRTQYPNRHNPNATLAELEQRNALRVEEWRKQGILI